MDVEACACIKINRLLEEFGWRFFDANEGSANVALEPQTKLTETQANEFGKDFEEAGTGFIEFLLLNQNGFPVPLLATRQAIVDGIEAGQTPVAANREVVSRLDRRIQVTLVQAWGEP